MGGQLKQLGRQAGVIADDDSLFDGVFQLADVAIPGMLLQLGLGTFGEADQRLVVAFAEAGNEHFGQRDNVLGALPERRDFQMYRVDSVQQVFAEFVPLHHVLKIAVGGANQADVDRNRGVAAYTDNAAALDGCQQFGLQVIGQVAYFVQEEGTLVGRFKLAGTVGMCVGVSAFDVAE